MAIEGKLLVELWRMVVLEEKTVGILISIYL